MYGIRTSGSDKKISIGAELKANRSATVYKRNKNVLEGTGGTIVSVNFSTCIADYIQISVRTKGAMPKSCVWKV